MLLMPEESTTSGTGAASAPAPAPAPSPAPSNAGAASEAPVDWAAESAPDDSPAPSPAPTPAAAPAAPAPQAAPAPPPQAPAPPSVAGEVKPGSQPPPAPAAAPGGQQPPAPAQPTAPAVKTPEQIAAEQAAATKAKEERFGTLVKQYTLPDDLAARLPTEPEQVLPYLAAKVHEHVMAQVEQMVAQSLPTQIQQTMEFTRRNEEAKSAFYKAWPTLNPEEHHDKVMMVGALFRQLNPTATREEAIKRIGRVVHESLGINLPPEAAPVAPPKPPVPAAQPFRPAGGGTTAAPAPSRNEFEQMAEQLLLEDAGPH